jgi:ribosome-binding ATPase YchF (GTP1/OBG family)
MKVGLIGHRGAGKTTVFNMLTGLQAQVGGYGGKEEVHLGVIKVPDARVDKLSQVFKPKKTTYAEIRFTDFPASQNDDDLKGNSNLVTQMREVDAMALVLRDFEPDADPLRQLNDLLTEMILADLTVVENRRARLKKEKGRKRRLWNVARLLWRMKRVCETLSSAPMTRIFFQASGFLVASRFWCSLISLTIKPVSPCRRLTRMN